MNLLLFQNRRGEAVPVVEFVRHNPSGEAGEGRWTRLRRRIYETYQSFREKFEYQERVCANFRYAQHLNVFHPAGMDSEQARQIFDRYLEHRYRKHTLWLWVDGVVAALGSLLTPIPGPNIFFFYPAARALAHLLARKGIQNIRSPGMVSFAQEPLMDEVQRQLENLHAVEPHIAQLEQRYRVENLKTILLQA